MSSTQCKKAFERFIRASLPAIEKLESELGEINQFTAIRTGKRARFSKGRMPNWWMTNKIWPKISNYPETIEFLQSLSMNSPFNGAIGKKIMLADGHGTSYPSAASVAYTFLVSYLFLAGPRWNRARAEKIWQDCRDYFDANIKTLDQFIYAPIIGISGLASPGMRGKPRIVDFGDGLELRRLSYSDMAKIGTFNAELAGVTIRHGLILWPSYFFVQSWKCEKWIEAESNPAFRYASYFANWLARLNEEIAIARSLLSRTISVPTYAKIRLDWPPDPGGGTVFEEPPWRLSHWHIFPTSISAKQLTLFLRRRERFLRMHGQDGWNQVMSSMRRYAIAWQNSFTAGTLADIVAALEVLLVNERTEVSYKLRVRLARLMNEETSVSLEEVTKNISDAYSYRSKVAHGAFVFDDFRETGTARRMATGRRRASKEKRQNKDVTRIHTLTRTLSDYYVTCVTCLIDKGSLTINWSSMGL